MDVAAVLIPVERVWRYSGTTKSKAKSVLDSLAVDPELPLTFSQVCGLRAIVEHERLLRRELPAGHRQRMFTTVATDASLQAGKAPEWMSYGCRSGDVHLEDQSRNLPEMNVQTKFATVIVDPVRRKWADLTGDDLEITS